MLVVLNLFITFGDTFLPSPLVYDHLYYEIARHATTLDALHAMGAYLYAENSSQCFLAADRLINAAPLSPKTSPRADSDADSHSSATRTSVGKDCGVLIWCNTLC